MRMAENGALRRRLMHRTSMTVTLRAWSLSSVKFSCQDRRQGPESCDLFRVRKLRGSSESWERHHLQSYRSVSSLVHFRRSVWPRIVRVTFRSTNCKLTGLDHAEDHAVDHVKLASMLTSSQPLRSSRLFWSTMGCYAAAWAGLHAGPHLRCLVPWAACPAAVARCWGLPPSRRPRRVPCVFLVCSLCVPCVFLCSCWFLLELNRPLINY